MIHKTLKFLTEQINLYFDREIMDIDEAKSPAVVLQNIALLDEDKLKTLDKIAISLVNIREDTAFKNLAPDSKMNMEHGGNDHPSLNLNFYILITAAMVNYETALTYLSYIIAFLNANPSLTYDNSSNKVEGASGSFRILSDLYSLSFEESFFLWSSLGMKQLPLVCYKLRIVFPVKS
jgi:hypothetical protein